jgi:hypothetical protein
MAKKNRPVPFAIDAFLTIGIVAIPVVLVVCIALPVILLFHVMQHNGLRSASVTTEQLQPKPDIPKGMLGAEGSACGGPERFPCNPGFVCSTAPDRWAKEYGTCIVDTRPTYPPGDVGDACDAERGCGYGLMCGWLPGKSTGTCVQQSPKPR